jgi:hypothetical protein
MILKIASVIYSMKLLNPGGVTLSMLVHLAKEGEDSARIK